MSTAPLPRIIAGIGSAGVTVLDRLALQHPGLKGLLIVNNDADSLAASVVQRRLAVPEGDPKEGFLAIEEEFGKVIAGAPAVLLCGGLGGETGSFLLPALSIRAKADGIPTFACVGMPFTFEGKARRELALTALGKLHGICDAVAVIDNDRLAGGAPSTAAIGDAFLLADKTLLSSMMVIRGMLSTSGPVRITRADLHAVLGIPGSLTHFGSGASGGSNRLHEALEQALKSPLLTLPTKAPALKEASSVLLLLSGPKDLSFAEVQMAVAGIERIAGEKCQIKVGVHAESPEGSPLELFVIASSGGKPRSASAAKPDETKSFTPDPVAKPPVAQDKVSSPAKPVRQAPKTTTTAVKQTQGVLDLENYQRGRFDKSEPTMVNGEDLDVPTFLRKGVRIGAPQRS